MPKIYEQSNMPLRDKLIDLYNRALESENEALANFIEQKLLQLDAAPQAPMIYNEGLKGGTDEGYEGGVEQESDNAPFTEGTYTKIPTFGRNTAKGRSNMRRYYGLADMEEDI